MFLEEQQRCHNQGNGAGNFNQRVHGRTGRIFERIAHRIADNGGRVGRRTFAAVFARFDVLLRIIPCAAGIGHEDRHQNAGCRCSGQEAGQSLRTENKAYQQRRAYGKQTGSSISLIAAFVLISTHLA